MKIDAAISQRISMLRTLLILSVVFLHASGVPEAARIDFSDVVTVLRCIFEDRFGRFAVPTLSMVSGYLLFAAGLDLTPAKLYKKKIKTLVVPFLVFNCLLFGIQYVFEYATGWAPLNRLTDKSPAEIVDALTGYRGFPSNIPLHFLRDLFVLALLAPLFGLFIRRSPWLGLAIVCGVFLPDLDGHLVNRDTMAVLFYVGGMAAVGKWNLRRFDRYAVHAAMALVGLCAAMVFLRIDSSLALYLASPLLVWIASARLVGTPLGNWAIANSKYSFFVFLTHAPLLRVVSLGLIKCHAELPLMAGVVGSTAAVTLALAVMYEAAMTVAPGPFNAMIGARGVKKPQARPATAWPKPVTARQTAFVERRSAPRPANAPIYSESLRKTLLGFHEAETGMGGEMAAHG
jgi:succinoglycan biosynthesis protein ExoH